MEQLFKQGLKFVLVMIWLYIRVEDDSKAGQFARRQVNALQDTQLGHATVDWRSPWSLPMLTVRTLWIEKRA